MTNVPEGAPLILEDDALQISGIWVLSLLCESSEKAAISPRDKMGKFNKGTSWCGSEAPGLGLEVPAHAYSRPEV